VSATVTTGAADVSLIGRAFAVLAAFRARPVQGVSELARATGLPRTTVHRVVNQLVDVGALGRVGTGYRLGPTLFELGHLHYPAKLRDSLDPFLSDLQRLTSCDVALCELVGRDVIAIHVANGRAHTSAHIRLGVRMPAHACSAGKVLLAYARQLPYGRGERLSAITMHTVTRVSALETELKAVRSERRAVEHGELEDHRSGVGVPVANRHGRILGALMVMGPTDCFDVAAIAEATAAVARTLTLAGQTANIDYLARAQPGP
jgi:IclR family transcriptional regulator, acetate operon repressor